MTRRRPTAYPTPGGWLSGRPLVLLVLALVAVLFATLSASSPALSQDGPQPPAAPGELEVSTEGASLDVEVDWDDVDTATSYRVRWRPAGKGEKLNEGEEVEVSEAEIEVADFGTWVVRVQACNDAGCGKPSAQEFEVEPEPEAESTPEPEAESTPEPEAESTPEPTPESEPVSGNTRDTESAQAQVELTVSVRAGSTTPFAGDEVTFRAVIGGAPADETPAYQWELGYGGDFWIPAGSDATFSYLAHQPETASVRVTVTYPSGASATSDPRSVTWRAFVPRPELPSTPGSGARGAQQDGVQGQSSVVLVNNFPQTTDSLNLTLSANSFHAQRFTTGAHALGYTLTNVELDFDTAPGTNISVTIVSGLTTSSVGTNVATLTNPTTLSTGFLQFTAPTNTTLDASTQYAVVVNQGAAGKLRRTTSTSQAGATGWTIADQRSFRAPGNQFAHHSAVIRIRVNGTANADTTVPTLSSATVDGTALRLNYNEALDTASTPATTDFTVSVAGTDQTPSVVVVSGSAVTLTLGTAATPGQAVTVSYTKGTNPIQDVAGNDAAALSNQSVTNNTALVANINEKPSTSTFTFNRDIAQAFTTGSNSEGYTLTSVAVGMKLTSVAEPNYSVFIHEGSTDSPGEPAATSLGELTTTSAPRLNFTLVQFDASGNGISLDASTEYWVVIDMAGVGDMEYRATASDNEDSGGAAGWTIADTHLQRTVVSTTWVATNQNTVWIRVNGSVDLETTVPTLSSATVDGTALKLNYNEALDTGSVPATSAFTVSVAGTDQTPSGVSVSGSSVDLTLGTGATPGQAVTVSYTVPGTNPIQDLAGNDAGALSSQSVTNNTVTVRLVANAGQADASGAGGGLGSDRAQSFTTGPTVWATG